MYNIKVHYVQVSEPCSVYLPRKNGICRSYMRSNRLYNVETTNILTWHNCYFAWTCKTRNVCEK